MFGTTNTGFPGATNFTNISVTFSLQSTPDFADYPYRATYSNSAVTSTAYASVTYSNEQATSGNFASVCQTFDGGVYLYAKSNVGTITIPTISIGFYQSGLNIDTTVTAGSQALITSGAVASAIASASKTLFCKIGKTSNTADFSVNAVLDVQYDDYAQQNDNGEVFTVTTVGVQSITVNKSGWYRLEHSCYLMRSTDGRIEASVRFNSTSEYLYSVMFCAGDVRYTCVLSQIIHMDAGDRVSPQIWGGSEHGGTIGIAGGNGRANFLSLTLMSLD